MAVVLTKGTKYGFEINFEIFLSQIHSIHSIACQFVMESVFKRRGILARNHGVYVEWKRNAGISQFFHSKFRIQSPSHSDLKDILIERSEIRGYVDISHLGELRHGLRSLRSGLVFCELPFQFFDLSIVNAFVLAQSLL